KRCHWCVHKQATGWAEHWTFGQCGTKHQRDDNASINLARYEATAAMLAAGSAVGPVGAAVKRGADRKTGPRPAGGREARKGSRHKPAEQPRDGVPGREHYRSLIGNGISESAALLLRSGEHPEGEPPDRRGTSQPRPAGRARLELGLAMGLKSKYLVVLREPFSLDIPYTDRQRVVIVSDELADAERRSRADREVEKMEPLGAGKRVTREVPDEPPPPFIALP